MQNNLYRDLIGHLKSQIHYYDQLIQANEKEIGLQLADMEHTHLIPPADYYAADRNNDCEMCLGECNGNC